MVEKCFWKKEINKGLEFGWRLEARVRTRVGAHLPLQKKTWGGGEIEKGNFPTKNKILEKKQYIIRILTVSEVNKNVRKLSFESYKKYCIYIYI